MLAHAKNVRVRTCACTYAYACVRRHAHASAHVYAYACEAGREERGSCFGDTYRVARIASTQQSVDRDRAAAMALAKRPPALSKSSRWRAARAGRQRLMIQRSASQKATWATGCWRLLRNREANSGHSLLGNRHDPRPLCDGATKDALLPARRGPETSVFLQAGQQPALPVSGRYHI